MSISKVAIAPTSPVFSTKVSEDNVFFENIPLLFNSPVVQVNTKTTDLYDCKTKLYVQTQVYTNFEYSVNNSKNFFGTVLAASALVWGVSSLLADKDGMAHDIASGAETIAIVSGAAFSTAHLLNAVVANSSNKDKDAKYQPKEVPNVYLSKN